MNLKALACHTRAHCAACRTDADWRERVTNVREFACPEGFTASNLPPPNLPDGTPPQSVKGVGDYFHELIAAKYGLSPCSKCLQVVKDMNQLGPEGCQMERRRLIQGIWQRRKQLSGWRKIAAKLPAAEKFAKRELNALLEQALKQATTQAETNPCRSPIAPSTEGEAG